MVLLRGRELNIYHYGLTEDKKQGNYLAETQMFITIQHYEHVGVLYHPRYRSPRGQKGVQTFSGGRVGTGGHNK